MNMRSETLFLVTFGHYYQLRTDVVYAAWCQLLIYKDAFFLFTFKNVNVTHFASRMLSGKLFHAETVECIKRRDAIYIVVSCTGTMCSNNVFKLPTMQYAARQSVLYLRNSISTFQREERCSNWGGNQSRFKRRSWQLHQAATAGHAAMPGCDSMARSR